MKKSYHICFSAGDEVCCRSEEDYIYCFNALALAIDKTESSLLADAIMSTHLHECLRTSCPKEFVKIQRYTYTRYFNSKYSRKGSLFGAPPFMIELKGLYHKLAALSYTLRNPLHHGIVSTPFEYRHSSARAIYMKALGRVDPMELLRDSQRYIYLPDHRKCPEGYRMDKSGLILREDVLDTEDVEHLFSTPRSYLYYMNRISGEEWQKEQGKDQQSEMPITLDVIEKGVHEQSISEMLAFEHGRSDYNAMNDLQVCEMIDNEILPQYGKCSVYLLSPGEKTAIANRLFRDFKLSKAQIVRCLAMKY